MTTVINTPGTTDDSGSNMVMILILILVIVGAVSIFFIYGLPMMQNYSNPTNGTIDINIDRTPRTIVVPTTPAP